MVAPVFTEAVAGMTVRLWACRKGVAMSAETSMAPRQVLDIWLISSEVCATVAWCAVALQERRSRDGGDIGRADAILRGGRGMLIWAKAGHPSSVGRAADS